MPRSIWSVAVDALITVVMLIGPALLASWLGWPLEEGADWKWLWQYLRGGRVPGEALLAFLVVVLWTLWAAYLIIVILDVIALLRGVVPRVGLVRLVWVLAVGGATATNTHTAAVAAHTETLTAVPAQPAPGEQEPEGFEEQPPDHTDGVVERIRHLPCFGFDSAELTPAMEQSLKPTIDLINDFGLPEAPVVVTGHTDPVGDPVYNQGLSERRAQAVADYLVQHVAKGVEFEIQGMGSTQPPSTNQAPYEEHRRVEIAYTLQHPADTTEPAPSAQPEQAEPEEATAPAPEQEKVRLEVTTASGRDPNPNPVLVGAVAGTVGLGVGYAAGRRRAPGTRELAKTTASEPQTEDSPHPAVFEPPSPDTADLLRKDPQGPARGIVDEEGYVLVSETVRVPSRGGLAFTGIHALNVLAAVIAEHVPETVVLTGTAVAFLDGEGVPLQGAQVTPHLHGAQVAVEAELLARERRSAEDDETTEEPITAAPPLLVVLTANDLDPGQGLPVPLASTPGVVTCVLGEAENIEVTLDCENTDRTQVRAGGGEATLPSPLRLWNRPEGSEAQPDTSISREFACDPESFSAEKDLDQPDEGRTEEDRSEEEASEAPSRSEERAPTKVRVRLFAPQVVCEAKGRDVLQGTRTSTYTLLAALALGPREGVSHQELTDILAPRMPETRARRFRSNALTSLRGAVRDALDLGPEVPIVENEKGRYRLQWEFFDVDVREFCELYADVRTTKTSEQEVKLRRMVSLYESDLLSERQDEWIEERRWGLQAAVVDVYIHLLDFIDDEEERIRLIDYALRVDRLNEDLHQEKMKNYALLGRKDAVRRCFQHLKDELRKSGEKPDPDSEDLFKSLMR